jgi:putative Mg2+ transporter-C (MgtC) family protein
MDEFYVLLFLLPKILMATVCGLIIGIERELKKKVAGIRTHVLICVGVTVFTSIAFIVAKEHYFNLDPTRIIGQIITGIGFLGGGVIFKNADNVVGITSAAFIWFLASIGVLIGVGYLLAPFIFTVGLVFASIWLTKLENFLK